MKLKTILTLFILLLGGYWFFQPSVGKEDIYVNRLVYLKKDSSLFTGMLKVIGKASYYNVTFCEGLPCGEWAEHQNGGSYVANGKYLVVKETLSENTRKLLINDTVLIDYWQEAGDLPSDPFILSVLILKDEVFFQSEKKDYDSYINQVANFVLDDTRKLKYNYLTIHFVNAVRYWSKDYSKEYKLEDGRLREIDKW